MVVPCKGPVKQSGFISPYTLFPRLFSKNGSDYEVKYFLAQTKYEHVFFTKVWDRQTGTKTFFDVNRIRDFAEVMIEQDREVTADRSWTAFACDGQYFVAFRNDEDALLFKMMGVFDGC